MAEVSHEEVVRVLAKIKGLMRDGHVISDEAREFETFLTKCKTEREITPWLRSHPWLIGKLVDARYPHVFHEFPVGTKYPDYVVLDSFSGGWDDTKIEFEPPTASLFTKGGVPARRLAGAVKQVDEWRTYLNTSRQEVLLRLADYYRSKDLTYGPKEGEARDCGGIALADPRSTVCWHYCIVVGRRSQLTKEATKLKAAFWEHHGIRVMTYDRLVEVFDKMSVFPEGF